jgi:hypothetical protein
MLDGFTLARDINLEALGKVVLLGDRRGESHRANSTPRIPPRGRTGLTGGINPELWTSGGAERGGGESTPGRWGDRRGSNPRHLEPQGEQGAISPEIAGEGKDRDPAENGRLPPAFRTGSGVEAAAVGVAHQRATWDLFDAFELAATGGVS